MESNRTIDMIYGRVARFSGNLSFPPDLFLSHTGDRFEGSDYYCVRSFLLGTDRNKVN